MGYIWRVFVAFWALYLALYLLLGESPKGSGVSQGAFALAFLGCIPIGVWWRWRAERRKARIWAEEHERVRAVTGKY